MMNSFQKITLGLGCLVSIQIVYAEVLQIDQNNTTGVVSSILQERNGEINKATVISQKMMAESELNYIKVIAKANRDKTITDAEAIKLKDIARVEAIKKSEIVTATQKAKKEILEINKEVESIKMNANYQYKQKIEEAEKKLNPLLNEVVKYTIEDIDTLLKDNQIKFISGTQNLTKNSIIRIKKIAELLKNKNNLIRISGYTDSDGSSKLNKKLSLARAKKVKKILLLEGLRAKNITCIGYGEKHPLVPNTTDSNKAKNRRIEIKIVK